jgi:short-subunit dehydrogenase
MRHPYRSIAITGASRGLGAALARSMAGNAVRLHLAARSAADLEAVATDCRAAGSRVGIGVLDVCDQAAVSAWLAAAASEGPLDLVIVNAGIFDGRPASGMEPTGRALEQLATNLTGGVITAAQALPHMARSGRGRIAFVLSLAAIEPLPDAPAYSASKAGLAAYAEALRGLLAAERIDVTRIFPGHILTAQTVHHVGRLPLAITAESAAERIVAGLARGADEIVFPRRLALLIRLGRLLPWRWRLALAAPFRFHIADDG